jgi:hypothetical protein
MDNSLHSNAAVQAWLGDAPLVPWLLSAGLHVVAAAGITFSLPPSLPTGGVGNGTRESGIVLVSRSEGGKAEYFSDHNAMRTPAESHTAMDAGPAPPKLFAQSFNLPQLPTAEPHAATAQPGVANAVYSAAGTSNEIAATSFMGGGPIGQGDARAVETRVFGVRGHGSRFVYVFDRSSSMEGRLLAAAKRELIASLESLSGVHQFQVIFYNDAPQIMPAVRGSSPRMVPADEPGKRLAAQFVGGISAYGPTNHIQALRLALQMKPDVIFLLTDSHEPQLRLADLAEVRQLNRGTVINAVEFGVGSPPAGYNHLRQLATENGGQHGFVNVGGLLR